MYEYIQNRIIEGTIKTLVKSCAYIFLFSLGCWRILDDYYFDGMEDYEPSSATSPTLNEETEYFGWEYEMADCLTCVFDYLFSSNKDENVNQSSAASLKNKQPVSYVDKYKEEWKKRETSSQFKSKEEIDIVSLKNNILIEQTPFGNVIMYYDHSKTSFIYYCDKTLSYPIVNSVGRKYSLTFGCESLYLDETSERPPPPTSPAPEPTPTPAIQPATKTKDVYAKFKKYDKPKTSSANSAPSKTTTTTAATQDEQINRYTCEGKLSNFSFLKKAPTVKPLSYKDFKMKFSKSSS